MVNIANYSVTKNFGHFSQIWRVEAETKEDAWSRAEKDGKLHYQTVYHEPTDLESKGYVVNLDEKREKNPPIPMDLYDKWLVEAFNKGMHLRAHEYERIFGLPFHEVQ